MIERTLVAAAVLAALAGCGGDAPEEKIEELSEKKQEAEERVEEAEKRVRGRAEDLSDQRRTAAERREALERERRSVAEAESDLEQAGRRLEEAKSRLAELRREIAREVTDVALFRHIQKALLEEESLKEVAIAAHVEEHVVTLSGRVSDPKRARRALRIAKETPGVLEVRDRIRVVAEETPESDETPEPEETPAEPEETPTDELGAATPDAG